MAFTMYPSQHTSFVYFIYLFVYLFIYLFIGLYVWNCLHDGIPLSLQKVIILLCVCVCVCVYVYIYMY